MADRVIKLPISPSNAHFGSAIPEFWEHADFSRGWIDGKTPWKGSVMNYLHVPCHVENEGECKRCDGWWEGTSHRLWPKYWPKVHYCGPKREKPPHTVVYRRKRFEVLSVILEKSDRARYGWQWVLTVAPKPTSDRG